MGKKKNSVALIPQEIVERKILLIRGKKVMLDRDLAKLYGVETKQLTRQVRRNIERFPGNFMFQLTQKEFANLKCHFGASRWGGTRKLPYAFADYGILMLSSVLNSKRAIQVNIAIMEVFGRIKEILTTHKEIERRLMELERGMEKKGEDIQEICKWINQQITIAKKPKRKIGFHT